MKTSFKVSAPSLFRVCALGVAVLLSCGGSAIAQNAPDSQTNTLSGYGPSADIETGDSVTADLAIADQRVDGILSFPRIEEFISPWFAWKKRINDEYGLKLQFSYQSLRQELNRTLAEKDAAAARLQLQGSWELAGRGTKNTGQLTFRLEERTTLGTTIPPTSLASQYGGLTPSGGFSDFGFALTELAWRQSLLEGRFRFVIGKISALS